MRRGLIIILSSPSGAGKSTLSDRLRAWDKDIVFSISATTREPRDGEKDGREYFFKSREDFLKMVDNQEMLEHAEVFGNLYGSPQKPVSNAIENGQDVLFDIDWQGADQIKNKKLDYKLITFFILPPSREVLFERLSKRHASDKLIAKERMEQFERDVLHWINYDYVVINNDLNECYSKITNLIDAVVNDGSKDYDPDYIRSHVEKLTS